MKVQERTSPVFVDKDGVVREPKTLWPAREGRKGSEKPDSSLGALMETLKYSETT
jgi:hypothetical protein